MDDTEFSELQLRMAIVPQQARWPAPDIVHWAKLHAAADEMRNSVIQAYAGFDAIDHDRDLSPEGKARQKQKLAARFIAEFEQSKTLVEARDAVGRQVEKWAEKTGLAVQPPSNVAETMMQCEVRAHLAAMKGSKMGFLEKHATDPRVASAVLGAPPFLSGLSDAEVALVQTRIEQHVAPDIAAARDATLKALNEAEHGWQVAMRKIGERAGLTKGPDGTWRDPTMSEAA